MNQAEIMAAPVLELSGIGGDKWELERSAFQRLLPELLKTNHGQYVAIHEGRAVANGERLEEVALQAYAQHGYVPIYVGFVTDEPIPPVRVPTPRVVGTEAAP